jgi:hypothetical protein
MIKKQEDYFIVVADTRPSEQLCDNDNEIFTLGFLCSPDLETLNRVFINNKLPITLRQFKSRGDKENYQEKFLPFLEQIISANDISITAISITQEVLKANEKQMVNDLDILYLNAGERDTEYYSAYFRHIKNGKPVVTLGPFEVVDQEGVSKYVHFPESISINCFLPLLWIAYEANKFYIKRCAQINRKIGDVKMLLCLDHLPNYQINTHEVLDSFLSVVSSMGIELMLLRPKKEWVTNVDHVVDTFVGIVNEALKSPYTETAGKFERFITSIKSPEKISISMRLEN